MRMRAASLASALLLTAGVMGAASSRAAVVPVEWSRAGTFDRTLSVAAGQFVEVCTTLSGASRVDWSFSADGPTDFNIHFHEGRSVEYPEKRAGVRQGDGRLVVPVTQDYCWMWRNLSADAAQLQLTLRRR